MKTLNASALVRELLEGLIALDTSNPPGNELLAAEFLAHFLQRYDLPCTIQHVGEQRANLCVRLGDGNGPSLLFNGHLDVVPASDTWQHPPFALTQECTRLYGRGCCDMKGGVAAMCAAAILLKTQNAPLHGTLHLVFVADEEFKNAGMKHYLQTAPPIDYAVIGEPTEMEVAVAHRGVVRNYLDISGKSHHAAVCAQEPSAIAHTAQVILALQSLGEELQKQTHAVLPPPSVAVTMIAGYEKDNIVPATVRLMTDFRTLPHTTPEQVHTLLASACARAQVDSVEIKPFFDMDGGELDKDDVFVQQCCAISGTIQNRRLQPVAFEASCEQCFLTQRGIKALICGPGSLQQAHCVDEYVEILQLEQAVSFYETLARTILQ